jgi:hypothetical protein
MSHSISQNSRLKDRPVQSSVFFGKPIPQESGDFVLNRLGLLYQSSILSPFLSIPLTKTPLFAQLLFSMHHRSIQKASSVKKLPYFLKILTRFGFGDIPNIYGPSGRCSWQIPLCFFSPCFKEP